MKPYERIENGEYNRPMGKTKASFFLLILIGFGPDVLLHDQKKNCFLDVAQQQNVTTQPKPIFIRMIITVYTVGAINSKVKQFLFEVIIHGLSVFHISNFLFSLCVVVCLTDNLHKILSSYSPLLLVCRIARASIKRALTLNH